jgi:hypothetical protein
MGVGIQMIFNPASRLPRSIEYHPPIVRSAPITRSSCRLASLCTHADLNTAAIILPRNDPVPSQACAPPEAAKV